MRDVLERAGATGFVHARDVDGDAEVGMRADEPVVLASVFKIPIVLEYARQAAAGTIDRTERLTITAADKDGGIGISGCADDVSLTLRDLAFLMMTLSDNAATDVLLRRVGLDSLHDTLAGLGLRRTRLLGGCAELFAQVMAELGTVQLDELSDELIGPLAVRDPERTTSGTPREITTLLSLIWRDEAGTPEACAEVRKIMEAQVWPHRLASGFDDDVKVSGKTGTLWGVRNEAGVVEYPDGKRYAVAVFLRTDKLNGRHPLADAAIGKVARLAVDQLRA